MPRGLVKCAECEKAGLLSQVQQCGPSTTTLLGSFPYYDSKGRYHDHDPNTTTANYKCSRGHEWTEHYKSKCWCQEDSYEENADKSLDGIVEDLIQYILKHCFAVDYSIDPRRNPSSTLNVERAKKAIAATLENYVKDNP